MKNNAQHKNVRQFLLLDYYLFIHLPLSLYIVKQSIKQQQWLYLL